MKFIFKKLSQYNAMVIADEWKYEDVYSFYDMCADIEDYEEFINEQLRDENDYYEAYLGDELVGFFCVIQENHSIEIGLGLKPNLCGKGIGRAFLTQILSYIENHYEFEQLIMNVAIFNQRAIKVYRACGFEDVKEFEQQSNGGLYKFLKMVKVYRV